jgi:type IV secretion system protein VirD4
MSLSSRGKYGHISRAPQGGKAGYKRLMLLMLDEFTSLGKFSIVERSVAYMAGYGCKAYFIVQDTKQLNQAYGQDNAIMANCHIRIAYAPNLPETAEYLWFPYMWSSRSGSGIGLQ